MSIVERLCHGLIPKCGQPSAEERITGLLKIRARGSGIQLDQDIALTYRLPIPYENCLLYTSRCV